MNKKDVWRECSKYYGKPEWKKLRKAALERDNYTCQGCGKKGKERAWRGDKVILVVHHIIERDMDGPDELENLTTLCQKCHTKVTTTLNIRFAQM